MSNEKHIHQDWFEVWEAEPGVHVIAEPFHFERVRSYLIEGADRAVLLDTGMGIGDIKAIVDELTDLPVTVLNSRAHWDHIGGNWRFDQIMIHEAEAEDLSKSRPGGTIAHWFTDDLLSGPLPEGVTPENIEIKASHATTLLKGGEAIDLGGRVLEIVHTPGHSLGGVVVVDRSNGLLFTTDVAYLAPLYAYAPSANVAVYRNSLALLESIASDMRLALPSHDQTPFDPAKISEMRQAFDDILAGRTADEISGDIATHKFHEFSVMVPAGLGPSEGAA